MAKSVSGKVVYQEIGPGFWGIIDRQGNEWRPVNMPNQLKYPGKEVQVKIREVKEDMSVFMWGTAVRIVGFEVV